MGKEIPAHIGIIYRIIVHQSGGMQQFDNSEEAR